MEWTRKHQNLTGTSANFVFRSSVNKAEQDLPVRQTKKQREQNREARKPREQSRLTEETSQEVHVFLFFFALTKVKLKTWEHRWGHKSIGYMLWTRQLTQVGCCFCFVVDVLVHIVVVLLFLLFVTISFFWNFSHVELLEICEWDDVHMIKSYISCIYFTHSLALQGGY